ncbi:NAD(P)H dehydrogenase (Quinone) OS=Castellaniella defragrans OX=75697 GN=HNR28_001991 PE=4 SV=1 [Castellaniella defragrans]
MTIAITGSTGQLGRILINKLKAVQPSDSLVALARTPAKAADLGVPVRKADYGEPATLARALAGVDTLMMISASEVGHRTVQHRNVIAAARDAGVRCIVYTSLLRADTSPLASLADEHVQTERMLQESGIPHTILRNGWYTENYLGAIQGILASGAVLGSAGEGRIASAARADYAEAALVVLTRPGHEGKVYELAGDQAYTLTELAAEIARQAGKPIVYRNLPEAEYASRLQALGLPAGFAAAIAGWDSGASRGGLFDDGHVLSGLIGRPTTPLSAVVAEALKRAS